MNWADEKRPLEKSQREIAIKIPLKSHWIGFHVLKNQDKKNEKLRSSLKIEISIGSRMRRCDEPEVFGFF